MKFRFEQTERRALDDDCHAYNVWRANESLGVLGWVEAHRTESWRKTSTGVRYGYRGKPKTWWAYLPGGVCVGMHYRTRQAAAEALVRA